MRRIDLIVEHCTASPEGVRLTVADLDRIARQRGFDKISYHYIIGLNGELWTGRREAEEGAHVKHYNRFSIGIVYVGGLDARGRRAKDTRTPQQKATLKRLRAELHARYPNARWCGHRDLSPDLNKDGVITPEEWIKECPCYNAMPEQRADGLQTFDRRQQFAQLERDPMAFPEMSNVVSLAAMTPTVGGRKPLMQRRSFWRDVSGGTLLTAFAGSGAFYGMDGNTIIIILIFASLWAAFFIWMFRKEIFG